MNAQQNNNGRLAGKVAWISGASSGIGVATAKLFVEEGAKVMIVARRAEQLQEVKESIGCDEAVATMGVDVANQEEVAKSIEKTVEAFGRLDILVNNAGMVEVKPLDQYEPEEWDRVMNVNLKSMYYSFKAAFPHMKQHKRSWVVNVGSISSYVGQAGTPVYTTSKHAIVGLTRSIALDYAYAGLRCNSVCPGITITPMLQEHLDSTGDPEGTLAQRLRRVPMGIPLYPEDVAKSILFFACDDSSGVTGENLIIDAGYLAAAEWDSKDGTAFQQPED